MQTSGLVHCALPGAAPSALRPAFKHGYRGNLVSGVGVFVDIKFAWRSGDDRKCLDGDVAFSQARQIDVASVAASEQVAAPEKAVGVKISDGKSSMQDMSLRGRLIRRWVQGAVESALDDAGQREPCSHQDCDEQQENPAPAFHQA